MSAKNVALCKALGWAEVGMRPAKAGFYDVESLTGVPPVSHVDEWKRQQNAVGSTIHWELPDYEHDIAAGLAALDATGVQWELRNHDDVAFYKVYQCEINAVMGVAQRQPRRVSWRCVPTIMWR